MTDSAAAVNHSFLYRLGQYIVSSKDHVQSWCIRQPHTLVLLTSLFFPEYAEEFHFADELLHNVDRAFAFPKVYEVIKNFPKDVSKGSSTGAKIHKVVDRILILGECAKSICKLVKSLLDKGILKRICLVAMPVVCVLGAVFMMYHNAGKGIQDGYNFYKKKIQTGEEIKSEEIHYFVWQMSTYVTKFAMGALSLIALYYSGNYFYGFLAIKTSIGITVTVADILKVKRQVNGG